MPRRYAGLLVRLVADYHYGGNWKREYSLHIFLLLLDYITFRTTPR